MTAAERDDERGVRACSRRRFLFSAAAAVLAGCAELPALPPARESGHASINGTRLYYEAAGAGETVVLLHAFTLDTRMWDDQFDALARRYRAVRYDARGFGRSDVPRAGEPYSHADDLAALLDHLGVPDAHVVGASMGGRFAIDFALTHAARVHSLALVDPVIGGWPWSRRWLQSYAPVLRAARKHDVQAAKAAWLAHDLFARAREQPGIARRLEQMVSDYSGWHFLNADPERTVAPPAVSQLGRVRSPTLAIVGERDLGDFQLIAERIAGGVAGARRVTVPAAGHLANMEAPDRVRELLIGFLDGQAG
ncbi:MAG: alpha/beta fold hydrolase [Burkholderiales bacterium]|nr:alpha/beta fold hydrolase [Burkholderiales bacterium]